MNDNKVVTIESSGRYRVSRVIDLYEENNIVNNDSYRKFLEDQLLTKLLSKIKEFPQSEDIMIVIHPTVYEKETIINTLIRLTRDFELYNISNVRSVDFVERYKDLYYKIEQENQRNRKIMKRNLWRNGRNEWKRKK